MKHHTLVCGTSKSKERDAYYIKAKHFWRSLYKAGITNHLLSSGEYRKLGKKYGIYLTELVDPESYIIRRDKQIEPFHLKEGLTRLFERIEDGRPNRIGFVGKNAGTWFYRYLTEGEISKSNHPQHKKVRRNLDYGCLPWKLRGLNWNLNHIDFFLLTNTHRQWNEQIWLDFWKQCKSDVAKAQDKQLAMF